MLGNSFWVCSGRYPKPLVVDSYFLVMVLSVTADSIILLILIGACWFG